MLAPLPGARGATACSPFAAGEGRVRDFTGRLQLWPVTPLNDTAEAAAEMCRRLGLLYAEAPC